MQTNFTRNTRPRVEVLKGGNMRMIWLGLACAVLLWTTPALAEIPQTSFVVAAAPQPSAPPADNDGENLTPEQRMDRRFPQPVRVGFLIGLPLLDWNDSTIGYIQQVVRTPEGKVQLIVPYHSWFGWVRNGGLLDRWRRPIAVPIETVAILARQVDALEMSRDDFDAAPTFVASQAAPVPAEEHIRIAITRR